MNQGKADMVPIQEKTILTIREAAALTGIGINKISDMCNADDCPFVLMNGHKKMIIRKKFDNYLFTKKCI